MNDAIEDCLDRLLAPKAIDPHWVAIMMHPHMPKYTLHDLEILIAKREARDGYQCAYQGPYEWEAK